MQQLWLLAVAVFAVPVLPSCLPDHERIDCLRDEVSPIQEDNIKRCNAKSCEWCPSSQPGSPWCYYRSKEGCAATSVDCGYLGISPEQCENRGCIYAPNNQGHPWCCRPKEGGDDCHLKPENRIDCFPLAEGPSSRESCHKRGCLWCQAEGSPWCFFNSTRYDEPVKPEYRVDCNPPGYRVDLNIASTITLYKDRIDQVRLDVEFQSDDRVRVKFSDRRKSRFEVPLDIPSPNRRARNPKYEVVFSDDPVFSMKILRRSTGTVIFDTSIGGLHMEDQFLQIATKLPSDDVYGFGENLHYNFRHNTKAWMTDGMFSRDQPPMDGANLYGVHPVYHVLEKDGNAHGVLILNSAAQDATLTPGPALIYRTIGGILDMYFFLGPTPDNVIQEYTEAVGRPVMPPYWSLGFSLAKFGYGHIDKLKENIDRMRDYGIPQDYQFLDIDYMDRNIDFTYSKTSYTGLPDYMLEQQKKGLKFIAILDPAIPNSIPDYRPLDLGNKMDVWVKNADGRTPVVGKVWPPGEVFYPDFTAQEASDWWVQMCTEFHQTVPYDGLWIDMNEPANFYWGSSEGCPFNNINYPPFTPKIWGPNLFYKTLCPAHKHSIGNHYDVHSLYGWSQAPPTLMAARIATGKRSLVLSRSTFPGAGRYAVHWLGDNWSRWDSMKASLSGMFEFNMFGMPFVGADICGFIGESNYELCMRWQQVGSFYPFARNHNLRYENKDQDPTVWGDDFARVARDTLRIRYTLLPFLYTLFHQAHVNGTSVIRPLWNAFPQDAETKLIDRQFLWGSSLLISPVLDEGATTVRAYFPDARWFSLYDGKAVATRSDYELLEAPKEFIPLHVRGGSVLPSQAPALNTHLSRKNGMALIIALDDDDKASGSLFWDDGESIETHQNGAYTFVEFTVENGLLSSVVRHTGYAHVPTLYTVRIMGARKRITSVTSGDKAVSFQYNAETKELVIEKLNLSLTAPLKVQFS